MASAPNPSARSFGDHIYDNATLQAEPQTTGPSAPACSSPSSQNMSTTALLYPAGFQSSQKDYNAVNSPYSSRTGATENYAQPAQTASPSFANQTPIQYGVLTGQEYSRPVIKPSTGFCYRHDPDVKCRRQADGPSVEHLQEELSTFPKSDQQGISQIWSFFSAAPVKQRELMLQGILAQCCFPQLSFVSASIRDLLKIDFLSALPPELGLKILCFLDPTSLCRAAQVSRGWREFADDDVVWHRMCEQHIDRKCTKCGWGLPLLDRQRLRTEKRLMQLRISGQQEQSSRRHNIPGSAIPDSENPYHSTEYMSDDSEENESEPTMKADGKKRRNTADANSKGASSKKVCTPTHNYATDQSYFYPSIRPWKDVYRDRFKVGTNWKYGRSTVKVLRGHTNGVMCVQFNDKILISGSYDSTIKIWDLETGQELRTLTGHSLGVRCLQFDTTKLVSGSLDGTVKMWEMKTGRVIRTFPGHSGAVISLHFDGMILASGSQDKTIRVRDFQNCSRVVLRGHTDWVNAVKVHAASQTLFSASDDCTVRMWDLQAKRCVRIFNDHAGQVQQVLPLHLAFDFPDPFDDTANGDQGDSHLPQPDVTGTLNLAQDATRQPYPRYILTAGLDSTVRLWEVRTGRCVRTFFGHLEGVWALAADSIRIVSGSNDGMVKIWDPRSGRCERTLTDHSGPVTCIGLSDRRMCTGSEDHEIRLYDFGVEQRGQ